jgi:hypothetical protein
MFGVQCTHSAIFIGMEWAANRLERLRHKGLRLTARIKNTPSALLVCVAGKQLGINTYSRCCLTLCN